MALLDIRNLDRLLRHPARRLHCGRRRGRRGRPQRSAGDRRRIGFGQVGRDAGGHGAPAADREGDSRPDGLRRRRSHDAFGRPAPPPRRQGHGDDLPGADVVAQPMLHRRLPDRRGAAGPSWARTQGARGAGRRVACRGRHSRSGAPDAGLSAPAFRRDEPARDDRHGARLPAEAPDRRRADDRARRDNSGADPRSPASAQAGQRHGAGADHP